MQSEDVRIRYKDGEIVDELDRPEREAEDLMLGMRMARGVSADRVDTAEAWLPGAKETFSALCVDGYAVFDDGRFRPTKKGWLFGNQVYSRILDLVEP